MVEISGYRRLCFAPSRTFSNTLANSRITIGLNTSSMPRTLRLRKLAFVKKNTEIVVPEKIRFFKDLPKISKSWFGYFYGGRLYVFFGQGHHEFKKICIFAV